MVKKLDIILPLFAGIIIGGISYFQKDSLNTMVLKLIVIIFLFYLIGFIIRLMIEKIYSSPKNNDHTKEILDKDLTKK
ncbi:hypothetical protein [Defluviitalea saccharophila]|uniref:Uncharacterized protein n=1 Tax=Defluviitalea saccharophila TaxID=879970 RepID=A0ABZ2Y720_9FIRM|nr:hypothetical protein [Candidatus Epulonipiscium sp.]